MESPTPQHARAEKQWEQHVNLQPRSHSLNYRCRGRNTDFSNNEGYGNKSSPE